MSGSLIPSILVVWLLATPPVVAQESAVKSGLSWPPHDNPTHLLITPRKGQTRGQQELDQWHCYDEISEELQWDPYFAYDAMVADGYAVALSRWEMERGLVFLAMDSAEVGAVAGDLQRCRTECSGRSVGEVRRGSTGMVLSVSVSLSAF